MKQSSDAPARTDEQHVTGHSISSALLRARRNAGSPAMGMVLTLLVVCEEKEYESALKAAWRPAGSTPPGSC